MKFASGLSLYQRLTQFLPGFAHQGEAFGPPRLDAAPPVARRSTARMQASLDTEGKVGIGAQAPICQEHIPGF